MLKSYLTALYVRDSPAVYRLISLADRKLKPETEYLREHPSLTGTPREVATVVASHIRYKHLRTVVEGDHATVSFEAIVPDANDPAIDTLVFGFDEKRLAGLSPAERRRIRERLDKMERAGRLPVIVGTNERWDLVRENGVWHVFLNWAGALQIHFAAEVKGGLPWAFQAVQPLVRVGPGETLSTFYWAKNLSHRTITAKARDALKPRDARRYLEVVTCFCFLQQTLAPGEAERLPVVFRVAGDVPKSVREISIHYELYPLDRFPSSHP